MKNGQQKLTGKKGEKIAAEILISMYDASLDQFNLHNWTTLNIWPVLSNKIIWNENGFLAVNSEEYNVNLFDHVSTEPKSYDRLLPVFISYGDHIAYRSENIEMERSNVVEMKAAPVEGNIAIKGERIQATDSVKSISTPTPKDAEDQLTIIKNQTQGIQFGDFKVRKIFNETAFFFPDLSTDKDGNISFGFTMPEALTQWKLMTFAHSRELASGYLESMVLTQKPLMVQPNVPRFMREGDSLEFNVKIVSLHENEITGVAQLELLDAATNKPIDGWFKNVFPIQNFTIKAGQSTALKFPLEIPQNFNSALTYRIIAKSTADSGDKTITSAHPTNNSPLESFSDGEESSLPVLINRMLVTETLPLNLRNTKKKELIFDKLLNSGRSSSITNHSLTVEYTTNPAWYAVQALPYLMESPFECTEHAFNRYYANILASQISNSLPGIKAVLEKWKTMDTAALISNLQKNEELKTALLLETPWVMDTKNENEQKKRIALLFDIVKMSSEAEKGIRKIMEMQSPNGGFAWFKGGIDDRYMTQYIITGIGHLRKLNALPEKEYNKIK